MRTVYGYHGREEATDRIWDRHGAGYKGWSGRIGVELILGHAVATGHAPGLLEHHDSDVAVTNFGTVLNGRISAMNRERCARADHRLLSHRRVFLIPKVHDARLCAK